MGDAGWRRLMAATPAITEISKNLNTVDLIALTRTSKATRAAFYDPYFMRVNLRLKLSRYFKDPDALLRVMRALKVIISGPRAVSMIWEDAVAEDYNHWEFMVTVRNFDWLRHHLVSWQGLDWVMGPEYDRARDVLYEWTAFEDDKVFLYVKVLISDNKFPITQMIGKHFLTVLNCFSSVDSTFVAYPEFTLNKLMVKRISSKREYKTEHLLIPQHDEKIRYWQGKGFTLIPKIVMKQASTGPAVGEPRYLHLNNQCTSPIKIMHKPYYTKHQQTEVQLGTMVKIREEKYRYVDFLPQLWIERTWMKMRPTFKIDPTSLESKAKGQDMMSWLYHAEKARAAKVAYAKEVEANANGEYSAEYIAEHARESQAPA
ncbi:hypothetical protein TWF696_001581 [Orbilia brochopaga]|uniref:F-box domain-containing protein n=1 Tax=Orbilia brochopaga TaxID=3140254 RepID=A0AAV9UDM7_9PEZI